MYCKKTAASPKRPYLPYAGLTNANTRVRLRRTLIAAFLNESVISRCGLVLASAFWVGNLNTAGYAVDFQKLVSLLTFRASGTILGLPSDNSLQNCKRRLQGLLQRGQHAYSRVEFSRTYHAKNDQGRDGSYNRRWR